MRYEQDVPMGCLIFIGIVIIILVGLLEIHDRYTGTSVVILGEVIDKRYVPEHYYTTKSSPDKYGRTTITNHTDPEEFYLTVRFNNTSREKSVWKSTYIMFGYGDKCFLHCTQGGRTNYLYINEITKYTSPEK